MAEAVGAINSIKDWAQIITDLSPTGGSTNVKALYWLSFSEYGWAIFLLAFGMMSGVSLAMYMAWKGIREEI